MMYSVENISLTQFKNYQTSSFSFPERITGICGKNGIGKTNLLDAIYYLCFTKSYFTKSDSQNALHGTAGFRVEGNFTLNAQLHKIVSVLRETGKKEFSCDDEIYTRLSNHIGKFPCVLIAPDDIQIITDGSEERRRFIDALLSQIDYEYLLQLIQYNKILLQRNSLLKQFADTRQVDYSLLDVLDIQLTKAGEFIYQKRSSFLETFIPLAKQFYRHISGEHYDVQVLYNSQLLQSTFAEGLARMRERDLLLQRTAFGVHKDDIDIKLEDKPFKQVASQGQRKSLLFALKLAEFETLKQAKGFPPILLLDDVFEKLDENRMSNLLQHVCVHNAGQVLLTDTHAERLDKALKALKVSYQIINL